MTKPRILVLGGSHGWPSHTGALLRAAERCISLRGGSTCRWDVGSRPLPAVLREPAATEEAVTARALVSAAGAADGLVIASPLYHGSYSGAVKDALDHLSTRELEGKPVALLSHSGSFPSTQALDHLRAVVRALHALAVPGQLVTVCGDYELCDDRYVLASREMATRLGDVVDELLWLATQLRDAGPRRPLAAAPASIDPRPPIANTSERSTDGRRAGNHRRRVVQRS